MNQRHIASVTASRLAKATHLEREVSYLSMNAVIRTDGAVKMTKPPSGKRKGELDLSSEEQTRIFNAA